MEIVLREIADGAGGQFDPQMTRVFLTHSDELTALA
jgi:HD-GYP domain-containing protein (c-di-GMP phosphodiesterase class II)